MARILAIEDNFAQAQTLRLLLVRQGHEVVGIAENAAEAEAMFDEHLPDLLLLDIRLRDGDDGIEVARLLIGRRPVPVIFVTAYADQPTFERAREAGPFAFLSKPYDDVLLSRSVELAFQHFRSATPAPIAAIGGAADGRLTSGALFVRDQGKHVRLLLHEVLRIEADGSYVHLHTATRKYTLRTSLREIEEKLPPGAFVRVQRAWLVQADAIEAVDYSASILTVGGQPVPIGRQWRDELRRALPGLNG